MNKGKITREEYEILKEYAPQTMNYVLFEEKEDFCYIYFTNHDDLSAKIVSDIILNNVKNRENTQLRVTVDEVLNQICERMYYY